MTRNNPVRVVPSTDTVDGAGVVRNVPGNAFDKHSSPNPAVIYLMKTFHEGVTGALQSVQPDSILDVGCGEGRTTTELASAIDSRFVGVDLELSVVKQAAETATNANFANASAYQLPFRDSSFDLVLATEMLEHLDRPLRAVKEMCRVARRTVVVTVPHEPWWRLANVARGRYLGHFGNTPGHVQHWSKRSLETYLRHQVGSVSVSTVGLWLLAVVDV